MSAGPALEMWSKQSGSVESSDGKSARVSMQSAYTVLLAANDPLEEVYNSAGLPLVGQVYPGSIAVFCTRLSPQCVSPIMAIVNVDYSGEVGPNGDPASSPVGGDPVLRWGVSVPDEAIDTDIDGKVMHNANGEPFDGLTEKVYDDVLTIERNFMSINRSALREYRRATNSDTFYGWAPGTARLIDDDATAVFRPDGSGTVAFWRVRAAIQFREPYHVPASKA